jgi:hypothetical protein
MHLQGLTPYQVFRRLVPIFGQQVATRAIAGHLMRIRLLLQEEEDPIHAVIEYTLQEDNSPATPAKLQLQTREKTLQEKCVICLEETIATPVTLPCRHSFCHDCIQPWFAKKNTCPTCRTCVDPPPPKRPRKRPRGPRGPRGPRAVRRRLAIRRPPHCRRCSNPMRGHPRGGCVDSTSHNV